MIFENYQAWIQIIEIPVFGGIMWCFVQQQRALQKQSTDFLQYKADASEKYATYAYAQNLENRIMTRLDRIEAKLDRRLERE